LKKLITLMFAETILLVAGGVNAALTVLDFGPALPGAPTGYKTILTNQLAGYGVTFSTTDASGVAWLGPTYPWAPARYSILAGDVHNADFGIDPIRVDFSTNVTMASIRGFNGGGDTDTITLKAFNSSDTMVDTMSITSVFDSVGHVATVNAPDISYITFEVSVAGGHGLGFDDLTYESTPIPAPGAILLGSIGVGLVGYLRRQRHI